MAVITDMGVFGTEGGILQPKLKNRWRVTFVLGNVQGQQAFSLQATTCERPKIQFDEVQLDRYNSRGWVAGKYTWQPIQMVFEDDTGGAVAQAIKTQIETQEKIIGVDGAPVLPASAAGQLYKFGVILEILDGNQYVFETWGLEGAWFQNIDWGDLDYSVSEAIKITATVRFDHARQKLTGISYKMNDGPTPLGE